MNPTIAYIMKKPANREVDRLVIPGMMPVVMNDEKREPRLALVVEGIEVFEIPGWEEFYSVSKCGRVWSHERRVRSRGGTRLKRGRWLRPSTAGDGYLMVVLCRSPEQVTRYIHRVVARMFLGETPEGMEIDHIDRDRANGSLSNLRYVTSSQNKMNSKLRKDNASGAKGVCWNKNSQKWMAYVKREGVGIHLGYFEDKGDAIRARDEAARKVHGEFAVLNNQ